MKHRVKNALSVRHELTNFVAEVLLYLGLTVTRISAEEFKVTLKLAHDLCKPISILQRVRCCKLASRDEVRLEDFQVFAEALELCFCLLCLNLVLDAHCLNLGVR